MSTKVFAFLALATVVNANDVIVGLRTDGKKIFDENRQANPALWRQMDNVTIKAPENEVIRRVVITDLRPDKDGDVKVVEGGEGQKNVTIELKSPTVLRGYEFHIEVYSAPEENVPFTNDQQSTTEIVENDSTPAISTNPTMNSDTTSELPDVSTDKTVPAILFNDEVKNNEREGRNAKNKDNVTSESTPGSPSTTVKTDASATQITENSESATENRSDFPNNFEHSSTVSAIPLNKNLNINPIIPAISGRDITKESISTSNNEETRHVRDTENEKSGSSIDEKLNNTNIQFQSTTENDKEATTTELNIPVEENSQENGKDYISTTDKSQTFDNRKYTSVISSKVEQPHNPVEVKDPWKLRNVRGANEELKMDESVSTTTAESTTTDLTTESTTLSSDDCVTTEATNILNPVETGTDNEGKPSLTPIYLNDRQWNQRFNNPTFQTGDNQGSPGLSVNPISTSDQSTLAPETVDAEHLGIDYKPSPDHMENRNPKISAISNFRDRNMSPVISTQ